MKKYTKIDLKWFNSVRNGIFIMSDKRISISEAYEILGLKEDAAEK